MGVAAMGLAWREAAAHGLAPAAVGEATIAIAAIVYLWGAAQIAGRLAFYPASIFDEWRDVARAPFASAAGIAMMLLATGAAPYHASLAALMWACGLCLHLGLAAALAWGFRTRYRLCEITPAWLITLASSVLAPVEGVPAGYAAASQAIWAASLGAYAIVTILIARRLLSGPALHDSLRPTLAILVSPPAVATIGRLSLLQQAADPATLALFCVSLSIAICGLPFLPRLFRPPFAMSWWSATYPLAALAIAAARLSATFPAFSQLHVVEALFACATGVFVFVLAGTAYGEWRIFRSLRAEAARP